MLTNVTMAFNVSADLQGSSPVKRQDNQPYMALTNALLGNPERVVNCDFEKPPAISNNNLASGLVDVQSQIECNHN